MCCALDWNTNLNRQALQHHVQRLVIVFLLWAFCLWTPWVCQFSLVLPENVQCQGKDISSVEIRGVENWSTLSRKMCVATCDDMHPSVLTSIDVADFHVRLFQMSRIVLELTPYITANREDILPLRLSTTGLASSAKYIR